MRESNSHWRSQSPLHYHYANPHWTLSLGLCPVWVCVPPTLIIILTLPSFVNTFFEVFFILFQLGIFTQNISPLHHLHYPFYTTNCSISLLRCHRMFPFRKRFIEITLQNLYFSLIFLLFSQTAKPIFFLKNMVFYLFVKKKPASGSNPRHRFSSFQK